MSQQSGSLVFPDLPEGVTLSYSEATGLVTISGDAANVRVALAEISFAPQQAAIDILNMQVEITQGEVSHQMKLSLGLQGESNQFTPLPRTKLQKFHDVQPEPDVLAQKLIAPTNELGNGIDTPLLEVDAPVTEKKPQQDTTEKSQSSSSTPPAFEM